MGGQVGGSGREDVREHLGGPVGRHDDAAEAEEARVAGQGREEGGARGEEAGGHHGVRAGGALGQGQEGVTGGRREEAPRAQAGH